MFKHILIPTDGSSSSVKAIESGIAFAKEMGARITGYSAYESVGAKFNVTSMYCFIDPAMSDLIERYASDAAKIQVARIGKLAQKAGVPFKLRIGKADDPADAIVQAAKKEHCDAIFMATHGQGAIASLLLGSVTQKVLARSKIPVLVFR